jgi:hypothetical protein
MFRQFDPALSTVQAALLSSGLCFVVLFAKPECAVAEVDATRTQADLLRLVAEGMQSNMESIRTWRGEAKITDHRWKASGLQIESETAVSFAYDAKKKALRWNFDVKNIDQKSRYTSSRMRRDDEEYRFGPTQPGPERDPALLLVTAITDRPVEGLSNEFHPMYFIEAVRRDPMPDHLRSLRKELIESSEEESKVFSVARDGFIIRLSFRYPNGVRIAHEFDERKSYNLVAYESVRPGSMGRWTFDFVELDGVYVPSEWTYEKLRENGDEWQVQFRRRVTFNKQEINTELPESEFTLDKMGMLPGDFVHDAIRGVKYRFLENGEGKLP